MLKTHPKTHTHKTRTHTVPPTHTPPTHTRSHAHTSPCPSSPPPSPPSPPQVDLGYNSREVASVRQLCMDILHLLEEQGGEHAVPLIRRYLPSVGPTASAGALARQAARAEQKAREAGKDPGWKPFTLF